MQPCCVRVLLMLAACISGALVARAALAQTACTAADVMSQDPGCPQGSGACSVTKTFQVGDGCVLDFGARALTISGTLDINSGTVTIVAASLTVVPGGFIDGRGNQTAAPDGGMLTIQVTGSLTVQKTSRAAGRLDVSGIDAAGTIVINAGGSVTVAGKLNADNLSRMGDGGTIRITAAADIISLANSTISASGGDQAGFGGGEIDLNAGGKVTLGDAIDVSGSSGGTFNVSAGDAVAMQMANASGTGDGGTGGCVEVQAGTSMQILDQVDTSGSASSTNSGAGSGGVVCVEAQFGDLTVANDVLAEGAAPDGGGGEIDVAAQGSVAVQPRATVSARSNGGQGCGGMLSIAPNLAFSSAALLDASGGAGGGEIDICAGTDVTLSGGLDVSGRSTGGAGGQANVEAGANGPGTLLLQSALDVSGGACDMTNGCGAGGCASLVACNLTVAATGSIRAAGPQGGDNDLTAREQLTILGKVNAAKTTASGTDGLNTLEFPQRKAPKISGSVMPSATMTAWNTCTEELAENCLMPCPTCGDGVVEFPETCDNNVGTPVGCDGCSTACQIESCDDGNVCTIDSCDPRLGCRHVPSALPCAPMPTMAPSPSATQPPLPTPTAGPEVTQTSLPARTAAPTAIPTAAATTTALATATSGPTLTDTPAPEPSVSPTQDPTPPVPGDANCDDQVTAADVSELVTLLASNRPASCGADADQDGVVDSRDIGVTIDLLFGMP